MNPSGRKDRASKMKPQRDSGTAIRQNPGAGTASTRGMWAGLALVAIGWAVQVASIPAAGMAFTPERAMQAAGVNIAQSLMLSGFGVAILVALQNGFGALHRFFEAVLQRSAAAGRAPQSAAPPPAAPDARNAASTAVAGRGRIQERAYVAYADGTVEVETLLGPRRFGSLDEARAFVGT